MAVGRDAVLTCWCGVHSSAPSWAWPPIPPGSLPTGRTAAGSSAAGWVLDSSYCGMCWHPGGAWCGQGACRQAGLRCRPSAGLCRAQWWWAWWTCGTRSGWIESGKKNWWFVSISQENKTYKLFWDVVSQILYKFWLFRIFPISAYSYSSTSATFPKQALRLASID